MKPLALFLFASWVSLGTSSAQSIEGSFDRVLEVSSAANLDVLTDSGGITVTAGSPGSVRIHGTLRTQQRGLRSADVESRIRQIESNPPIEQSGNTIRIGHVSNRRLLNDISMRLEIEVPPDSQLLARADSGGIRVEGIGGPVDCKTDSGGIEARRIGADIRAVADSGGIRLRDIHGNVYARADSGGIEALDIAGGIDAQTDSGGLRLSQTTAAQVRARTDSGGATVALVPSAGYDLRVRSESGRIIVPEITVNGSLSRRRVEGQVRSGGPLVDVEVGSGNVEIR